MPKIMKNGIEYGGDWEDWIWNNINVSPWQNMTVYYNRLPSGYIAKYAVVNKTAYIYIYFYQLGDASKFDSGFCYSTMFRTVENAGLPVPIRETPLIVADRQGVFISASVSGSGNSVSIVLNGTPQNYNNSKGVNFPTVIQGQYQIKQ